MRLCAPSAASSLAKYLEKNRLPPAGHARDDTVAVADRLGGLFLRGIQDFQDHRSLPAVPALPVRNSCRRGGT